MIYELELIDWINSDNVVKIDIDQYVTQCTQYNRKFTYNELDSYFIKEYINI